MNKNMLLSVQYEQLFDVGTLFFTIKIIKILSKIKPPTQKVDKT